MKRITNIEIAEAYGQTPYHVSRVLNSRKRATPEFRKFLADMVKLPESELFRDDEPVAS